MKSCFFSLLFLLNSMSLSVAQEFYPSSMKWGEINFETIFSLKEWKEITDQKSAVADWESVLKERSKREKIGKFFHCVGNCRVDRGESFFNPKFQSTLYEGDEIRTLGDSYAWIFLFDGTMIRLSPESSIIFNEINIGTTENFINARINMGNVLWLSRNEQIFDEVNFRETDVIFNPLPLFEAQPSVDPVVYDEANLISFTFEKKTNLNQYIKLNKLIVENNKWTHNKPTYAFLIMPNATILGYNPSVEMICLLGSNSYIKKRSRHLLGLQKSDSESSSNELFIQMRGFENRELKDFEEDKWLHVDSSGKSIHEEKDQIALLSMGEFLTKRIPSLMIARELMLKDYSEFAFREKYNPKNLLEKDGFRLWGSLKTDSKDEKKSDLAQRLDFLKEYSRRIETTNLVVSGIFSKRLQERKETLKTMNYGDYFFSTALNKYYQNKDETGDRESGEILNSTTKKLWKKMHGTR